mmetsp:Transcript_5870/g.17531  ORF Transcript_5870/g.17531 Transcript_5870/m.17531 type:complete len:335 (-) Transcript_5870:696-1700(-)|eukprot:CAMPEP_0119546330 /NCGR_PEP_ID=MMETSP1352-20130426/801_1 /TAXON_ID=265584 /ORGANISM="Stauroneis constricta, Strain CCMP1120" /LENGTH=334 /DNA_ID=CAMNT_0007591025 /DNA_START=563 /DNA_END=1567 /DNA_ORIENTATION=-
MATKRQTEETAPDVHETSSDDKKNATTAPKTNNHPPSKRTASEILVHAAKSAFRGGTAGFIAMILQVVLLMWLRTVLNYQYRHRVTIAEAFTILYNEGGIARFYQGASFALLSGPLSRFGDTAANEGVRALFASYPKLAPAVEVATICASIVAGLWRVVIAPLDTLKTTLQVSGKDGWDQLLRKVETFGFISLYNGAYSSMAANIVGHFPYFATYNRMEAVLPPATTPQRKLLRRAFIGLVAGGVSDIVSNGLRVLKTYQQSADESISFIQALTMLLEESGPAFIFRGLGVKLIGNALSSILFAVLWKMIMEKLEARSGGNSNKNKQSQKEKTK